MKVKAKKMLAILLALVTAFAAFGCGEEIGRAKRPTAAITEVTAARATAARATAARRSKRPKSSIIPALITPWTKTASSWTRSIT